MAYQIYALFSEKKVVGGNKVFQLVIRQCKLQKKPLCIQIEWLIKLWNTHHHNSRSMNAIKLEGICQTPMSNWFPFEHLFLVPHQKQPFLTYIPPFMFLINPIGSLVILPNKLSYTYNWPFRSHRARSDDLSTLSSFKLPLMI